MKWRVRSINTQSGAVTMAHSNGYSYDLTIPPEHRGHADASNGFISGSTSSEETSEKFLSHVAPQPQVPAPQSSKVSLYLSIAALIPAVALLVWFIMRALK